MRCCPMRWKHFSRGPGAGCCPQRPGPSRTSLMAADAYNFPGFLREALNVPAGWQQSCSFGPDVSWSASLAARRISQANSVYPARPSAQLHLPEDELRGCCSSSRCACRCVIGLTADPGSGTEVRGFASGPRRAARTATFAHLGEPLLAAGPRHPAELRGRDTAPPEQYQCLARSVLEFQAAEDYQRSLGSVLVGLRGSWGCRRAAHCMRLYSRFVNEERIVSLTSQAFPIFSPSTNVWGSLLENGNAPGWMRSTRI